jgi:hypothetical protein
MSKGDLGMENSMKELISKELVVINIGLEIFAQALEEQGVKAVHVDWSPPAGGDLEMIKLLDQFI